MFIPPTTALQSLSTYPPRNSSFLQAAAVDQLQLENRELRGVQERFARKERRARDLKKKNAHLGEQHTALLEDYEACQEQASGL